MKNQAVFLLKRTLASSILFVIFFIGFQTKGYSLNKVVIDTIGYNSYKGIVVEGNSNKPLEFSSLSVNNSNISTVSNSKGEFLLKVPKKLRKSSVVVSFLGYTSKVINLSDFNEAGNVIELETYVEELSEVNITVKDAPALMREVLKRRKLNHPNDYYNMTAFYREVIKKRRTYVSLSEAIVLINKQPYTSSKSDILQLHKSRKSTDYDKLDTIALKHKGGPFSTINLDVAKNPELLFSDKMFENYKFSFDTSTKIDDRVIYVVNFKGRTVSELPSFYGKLYVDAQTLAITSAQFQLDLSNESKASRFFIIKKPSKVKVTPVQATYYVDYRESGGKWFHSYSRIELGFKVNWDKKMFNSIYYSTMEMAITDWSKTDKDSVIKSRDRLKSSVILSDEASGFSDPEFWGDYNLIEPEKPIETAIKKIQKQLNKIQ